MPSPDSARRELAIKECLIGVHPLGMRRSPAMTELWGFKATGQLSADLNRLGSGDPLRRRRAYRRSVAGYRQIVEAALDLHPQAILSNSHDGGYRASDRKDRFYDTWNSIYSVNHKVFLPFLPGGFLEMDFGLEGPLDQLHTSFSVQHEYFHGDPAGSAADQLEHEERNAACILAARDYIVDVSTPRAM